jgi:hypothetical protein
MRLAFWNLGKNRGTSWFGGVRWIGVAEKRDRGGVEIQGR